MENAALLLTEEIRKAVLADWPKREKEEIDHPLLRGRAQRGLLPDPQSSLLTRTQCLSADDLEAERCSF
jgi:CRISP-associated protein Cas1